MSEIVEEIKTDKRKSLRDIRKILGKDILKFLAEPLTNSDDSYERLESMSSVDDEDIKLIEILLDRQNREISIVDHAEGMSQATILKVFKKYGADTSGNLKVTSVRGMFGQGATDVMYASAIEDLPANIISIKDSQVSQASFHLDRVNGSKKFTVNDITMNLSNIRKEYGIPQNGTIFKFGVPGDITLPKTKNLADSLSNFYMLRFLFTKQNRQVVLVDKNKDEEIHLIYNAENYDNLSIILDEEFPFSFQNFKMNAHVQLKLNPDKKVDDGILVFENGIVLDNQFFDRKNAPGMDKIEGTLQLEGALDTIRGLLNSDKPEEVLSDSRDGFNRNHEFFKSLKKAMDPILIRAGSLVAEQEELDGEGLKSTKEFRDVFKEINKLMQNELDEITSSQGYEESLEPPIEGLRFVRSLINITIGKQYFIKLIVNTDMVKPGSLIEYINSNKEISIRDKYIVVPTSDVNPVMVDVYIEGITPTMDTIQINAQSNDCNANLFINVISKNIYYPNYGLEFHPKEMHKKATSNAKANLYVSFDKYPIGTKIVFTSSSSNLVFPDEIVLEENHKISDDIGMISLEISGGVNECNYVVTAQAQKYETKLAVFVNEKEPANLNKNGYINDIDRISTTEFVQSYYDSTKGIIFINQKNPENNVFLKTWFDGRELSVDQKKFVADLASTEIAKFILKKQYEKGKLDITDFEVTIDELQKEKLKIFNLFLKIV